MKYYYLNDERKPQGPYGMRELTAFKEGGLINDSTLAAAAGDSKWVRLDEILRKQESATEDNCSTWNNELGNCPHCRKMIEGTSIPEQCPHCNRFLHGATRGLWYAFVYAILNTMNYRGRATRTEFWGFYLFCYIISFVLGQIGNLFQQAEQASLELAMSHTEDAAAVMASVADYFTSANVLVVNGISFLVSTLFLFPCWAVTARRLHDTGRSICSLIIGIVSYVALMISSVAFVYLLFSNLEFLMESESEAAAELIISALIPTCVSLIVYVVVSIYLFIMMVLPSTPGPNKYGPSTLFPHR